MQAYLIAALIFAIAIAAFAVQNTMVVTVHFLLWQADISLVLVILGSLAAGALLLFFLGLFKQYSNHRQKKDLKTQNKRMEKMIAELNKKIEALEGQGKTADPSVSGLNPGQTAFPTDPTTSQIPEDQTKDPLHADQ